MRILALSDIHGDVATVRRILLTARPFDVLIIAGDLTTGGTLQEAEGVLRRFIFLASKIFAVGGNMDPSALDPHLNEFGVGLDGCARNVGDVGFFGVSGSPTSILRTPNERPEDEMMQTVLAGWQQVWKNRKTVLVSHAPPSGVLDQTRTGIHAGSRAVRQFVEGNQPDLVICGHIHEARGTEELGRTVVVNCGTAQQGYHAMIDIEEKISVELLG